jgi:hypothetical protein
MPGESTPRLAGANDGEEYSRGACRVLHNRPTDLEETAMQRDPEIWTGKPPIVDDVQDAG